MRGSGLDRSGSEYRQVAGTCECGNEPSGSTKCGEFLNPFQSRDAIWHHTFNSVLHMVKFWGAGKG
jgi:hypothetical protein